MTRHGTPRIAALYDIHGNAPALEAALHAAQSSRADVVVLGGDLVLGPLPRETIDRLQALAPRARAIRGNCDRLVVDAYDGRSIEHLPAAVRDTIAWTAAQLTRADRDFLADLPMTLALECGALGEVLFCHATPRSDEELFTARTPDDRVRPMFAGVIQSTVVCGHTHLPLDRRLDGWRIVNAGSVGMAVGALGAQWLLLADDVTPMVTPYDRRDAARRIEASGYPGAGAFVERHVHSSPTPEAVLALLEPSRGSAG
jgi:putative phosphoesterase